MSHFNTQKSRNKSQIHSDMFLRAIPKSSQASIRGGLSVLSPEPDSLVSAEGGNATGYAFNYSNNHTVYQGHYTQIAWADAR